MQKFDYKKITNITIDGIYHKDYPRYCDAFIDSAYYDGKKMTDKQLDQLNEDRELVSELVWDNLELLHW